MLLCIYTNTPFLCIHRFSASHRTYRYFFQRKDLNITAMRTAAQLLLGSHDFRNICKIDIANVSNFVRDIYAVEIRYVL